MRQLQPSEVLALCASGPAPLLLDVREAWEVAAAAIRLDGVASRHIVMDQIPARLAELDPAQAVLCICHHGLRSAQVASFLTRQGFDSVYNLAGGIDAWSQTVDPAVPRY
jgi:rhodanese-related sulfurtransferase